MKAHTPRKNPFTISACTIARNESRNIARSIRSYRDFVDEIVVVDTGSTDDTAEIARSLGARVVRFDWRDDFAAARNFALDQVSGDWIIFLDADEYFSKNAGAQVRRSIETARLSGHNIIGCKMLNIDTDHSDRVIMDGFSMRIMKSGVRYCNRVHEEPCFPEGRKILFAEKFRFFLYHTGYSSHISAAKAERNLPLLLKEQAETGDANRRGAIDGYLSDAYITLREYEKCREVSEKFIRYSQKSGIVMLGNVTKPYMNLLAVLDRLDAPLADREKWTGSFCTAFPGYPDADFARAGLDFRRRRLLTAERELREVLRSAGSYAGTEPCHIAQSVELCHHLLGRTLAAQGRVADAMGSFFEAWRIQPACGEAVDALLSLIRGTPAAEQDAFIRTMFENPDPVRRKSVLAGLARQYMARPLSENYARSSIEESGKELKLSSMMLAYIAAGSGNYAGASELFAMLIPDPGAEKDENAAMRALLCAYLAGTATPEKIAAARPALAAALGLADGAVTPKDLRAVAGMAAEAGRMAGPQRAAGLAGEIADRLDPALWHAFAVHLEEAGEFAGALRVAQRLAPDGESTFLIGYYAMRLGRPGEALLAFWAAGYLGCGDPALGECLTVLTRGRGHAGAALPAGAEEAIGAGDFAKALPLVLEAVRRPAPDQELCSMASVCYLETGRPRMALLAAQAGLRADAGYADLLVNAGDARAALHDPASAARDYEKARRFCRDPALAAELEGQIRRLG